MNTRRLRTLVNRWGWLGVLLAGTYVGLRCLGERRVLVVSLFAAILCISCLSVTMHQEGNVVRGGHLVRAVPEYAITDLGTFGNGVQANRVNNAGHVAGLVFLKPEGYRAFLWRDGNMEDLGTLPGGNMSLASDVNNVGQVVGQAQEGKRYYAFLWQNGKMTNLGSFNGRISGARAMNDQGQVVGFSSSKEAGNTAVLWENGRMTALERLPGYEYSFATGINEAGLIVGDVEREEGNGREARRAVLWRDGKLEELGTLGGEFSMARAVNDRNHIVGGSTLSKESDAFACAFLWENGRMQNLGKLPAYQGSWAADINNQGDVVGSSGNESCSDAHACLWREGQVYDLNNCIPKDSGWVLWRALGINDRGQITGDGTYRGQRRGFLLTPIQR